MPRASWHLDRRTFLRGAGLTLALPWLEAMSQANQPAERPKRFCAFFFGNGVALPANLPDRKAGPEALACGRLELAAVLETLQVLPEVDRAALLMHVQDDLPYATIAAALGLSVAAVKVKVHRARIRLNQLREPERGQS